MSPALSLWLDLLRLLAAAMVFFSHAGTQRISGGLFHQATRYGEAAVDVFFVISGFVIAHATAARVQTLRDYVVNRSARIYSVVLPALLLGWLLDAAGAALDPALYEAAPKFAGPASLLQLASTLLFLDHSWFRAAQPGTNLPFWSLSFEVWYYVAFGFLVFARGPWNVLGALAALALAGPKIALLFPLWLLGVACRYLVVRNAVPRAAGWPLLLGPFVVLALWPDPFTRACFPYSAFTATWECIGPMGQDYGIGLLVAAHLLGVHALADRLGPLVAPVVRPVAWLAGASFTLYLLHYPLIHFLAAASPWEAAAWPTRALVFLATPMIVLAVAEVTERRKGAWRRGVAALAAQMPGGRGRGP